MCDTNATQHRGEFRVDTPPVCFDLVSDTLVVEQFGRDKELIRGSGKEHESVDLTLSANPLNVVTSKPGRFQQNCVLVSTLQGTSEFTHAAA